MQLIAEKLLFEIAGIPFELSSNSETILTEISQYWTKFNTYSDPKLKIQLIDVPEKQFEFKENPKFLNWDEAGFELSLAGVEVKFDAARQVGILRRPYGWGWGDILRQFFSLYMVYRGGVLLHGAAIEKNNKVFIFSGPSESGKTTLSRLRQDRNLLTDESIALLPHQGKTFAHSTPFFGELFYVTQNMRVPVTDIFYIFHGKEHCLTSLSEAEALKHFLRNTFNFYWCQKFCDALLSNLAHMVETFRSHRLEFLPNESVWGYLKEVGYDL